MRGRWLARSALAPTPAPAESPAEPPTKKRKVSLGGLLGKVKKEKKDDEPTPEIDELEQYLADSEEPDIEVDVLAWWKAKESKWPALAKMVKQYFAAPASSAGVERVFSVPRPPVAPAASPPPRPHTSVIFVTNPPCGNAGGPSCSSRRRATGRWWRP